jgi:hypothetical protein
MAIISTGIFVLPGLRLVALQDAGEGCLHGGRRRRRAPRARERTLLYTAPSVGVAAVRVAEAPRFARALWFGQLLSHQFQQPITDRIADDAPRMAAMAVPMIPRITIVAAPHPRSAAPFLRRVRNCRRGRI